MKNTRKPAKAALVALLGPASDARLGRFWLSSWDATTGEETAVLDAAFGPHRAVQTCDGQPGAFLALVWTVEGREVRTNRAGQVELW